MRWSARFLDEEARAAFKRSIETIERTSAVEVVVSVRRRSHNYRHANFTLGMLVAFASLAVMLFANHEFALSSILIDPFVVGLIAVGLVELLPGVKRWLTPAAQRRHHIYRAARATFVDRGVHNTVGRTGLLVYISWLEQQVTLVADTNLARALPADALTTAEQTFTARMRDGGASVAAALEAFGPELAKALPRRTDDLNELPDAIDSDLGTTQ